MRPACPGDAVRASCIAALEAPRPVQRRETGCSRVNASSRGSRGQDRAPALASAVTPPGLVGETPAALVLAAALVVRQAVVDGLVRRHPGAGDCRSGRLAARAIGAAADARRSDRGAAARLAAWAVIRRVPVSVDVGARSRDVSEAVALVLVDQLVVGEPALVHRRLLAAQVGLGSLTFGRLLRDPRLLLGPLGPLLALDSLGAMLLRDGPAAGLELALGLLALGGRAPP